jgi:hypothetical protein
LPPASPGDCLFAKSPRQFRGVVFAGCAMPPCGF